MFPGCRRFDGSLDALLKEAAVTSAVADRQARTLELELRLKAPIAPVDVAAVEQAVAEEFGLASVTVTPIFPSRTVKRSSDGSGRVILGKPPKKAQPVTPMRDVELELGRCTVQGEVFAVNHREIPKAKAWVVSFDMTDHTGSVHVSRFMREDGAGAVAAAITEGMTLRVAGTLGYSRFDPDLTLTPELIVTAERTERRDLADRKRVELHLHTVMSAMDALTNTEEVIKRAIRWGHPAIAITDHGVVQSFPDAMKAAKDKIKVLYGVEGYYVNDVDDRTAVYGPVKGGLDGEIVAFDIETTGLNTEKERITEIGAVLLRNGEEAERFQTFVDPGIPIPPEITRLTGIRNEDVAGAPGQEEAVRQLLAFAGGRPLAAHNAGFDIGFIYEACERYGIPFEPAYVDTLALSRALLPDLKNHRLDTVADRLSLPQFNHHRASDDAVTAGLILGRLLQMLRGKGVERAEDIDPYLSTLRQEAVMKRRFKPNHIILLVKSQAGIKNLYRIITDSHLKYFHRYPIMPKSLLMRYREGLLIGSACEAGEVFRLIADHRSRLEQRRLAEFYDYLEIMPISNNMFMLRGDKPRAANVEELRDLNRRVVALGEELGKPVAATGDVHFLDPEDEIYRHVLLTAKGFDDGDEELPLYFRTTDEMLEEFAYLGPEKAEEVVVTVPRAIADSCETVRPLPPEKLFPPRIEHSAEQL